MNDVGDQTDPSIDGQYVVYAGPASGGGGADVFLYDTVTGAVRVVAGGAGDQRAPDLWSSTAISLEPEGVVIRELDPERILRAAAGDVAANAPAVGAEVAAWEIGPAGARDVRVCRYRAGEEYTMSAPDGSALIGDQLAPAVWGGLVGYVDGRAQGAAMLHDSATRTARRICEGTVTGLSIGHDGAEVVVAVARAAPEHDADVEVYDAGGGLRAALRVPGVQQNPHLARDWVAFEDVSTSVSQVVLWNWTTGLVFVPHPTRTQQTLNDLSFVLPGEVRVAFEDTARPETGRDIALYVVDVYPGIIFDDQPNGYPLEPVEPPPVSVCDPAAPALATLALARATDQPEAGQAELTVTVPDGAAALPVVVCVEAESVSAAWVMLDDVAVATPSDFEPSVVSLARPANLAQGTARLSGVIAGKPGARLRARLVADPSRAAPTSTAAASLEPSPAGRSARREAFKGGGCGTACQGAGLLSLLAMLLLPARGHRRS